MPEIPQKPPTQIRIRTLQSDVEQMRQSGGEVASNRVLGQNAEEIQDQPSTVTDQSAIFAESELSATETGTKPKNKLFLIIIIAILIIAAAGTIFYFVIKPKNNRPAPIPTASATPQFSSLLLNFSGPKIYERFSGNLDDFEKFLSQTLIQISEPDTVEEIIFLKDDTSAFPANTFIKSLFSNFPNVSIADLPDFQNDFSLLISSDTSAKTSIAYVLKINDSQIPTFAIANIKSRFGTALENMLSEQPDLLTSQYLENPGTIQNQFTTKAIGPINARFLKFSTNLEFYYGFYQNYLIIATSQSAFQKLFDSLIPKT